MWEVRTEGGDPVILSNNNTFDGDVYTSSGDAMLGSGSTDHRRNEGEAGIMVNPTWDLDKFLVPERRTSWSSPT